MNLWSIYVQNLRANIDAASISNNNQVCTWFAFFLIEEYEMNIDRVKATDSDRDLDKQKSTFVNFFPTI